MPYGKRKRYKRRKKNKKALIVRRKANPWASYALPYPQSRKVKLRYTEYNNQTAVAGDAFTYQFNINSLNDPNATGVGDQPRYFDQLCSSTLYHRYQVDAVHYKITFINKNAGDAQCGFRITRAGAPFPGSLNPEGLFHLGEQSRATVRPLLGVGETGSRTTFTGTQSIWPIIARSKSEFKTNVDSYGADYNASPAEIASLTLYGSDNPQDANVCDIDWYVEMVFYATVFERNDSVAQS